MTITVTNPSAPVLSEHDVIIRSGSQSGSGLLPSSEAPVSLGVSLHLHNDTPVLVRLHPDQGRIVLSLGTSRAEVDVYLTAGQIERLVNVLSAARERLSAD
jgi:hypothetical protein